MTCLRTSSSGITGSVLVAQDKSPTRASLTTYAQAACIDLAGDEGWAVLVSCGSVNGQTRQRVHLNRCLDVHQGGV